MVRLQRHFTKLFLPLALVGLHIFAAKAMAQRATETFVYSPPTVSLAADQSLISACEGDAAVVHLTAKAISPSGNPIRYRWTVNSGRIEGEGSAVTWNLAGAQPGQYKANLVINTGTGDELCEAYANTIVALRCTPPLKITCPNVGITCPDRIQVGQPVTFMSSLTGGSGNVPLVYNWTVSAGRIVEGQGTSSIRVDTTGLEGQSLKATLAMGGFEEECSASCTLQFPIPLTCRKFDEFPDIARNDEKARLDNFAIELQNDPTSTGYVVVYPSTRGRLGTPQIHSARIIDYMVNSRGFDSRRMVTLVGPAREELKVELWVCPQGAPAPTP